MKSLMLKLVDNIEKYIKNKKKTCREEQECEWLLRS
jgi:hypothetical protein